LGEIAEGKDPAALRDAQRAAEFQGILGPLLERTCVTQKKAPFGRRQAESPASHLA
jgi:hypothetical protein